MRNAILAALLLSLIFSAVSVAQPTSSIRVTVINSRGTAIPEAEVHIVDVPTSVGIPASDGTFSFKNVPQGTHCISATYAGYGDKIVDGVVVVEGKVIQLTVKLEESPPKASDYKVHQELENLSLYSKQLTEVGQTPLCQSATPHSEESYRFLLVPTFSHPVLLRLDVGKDGTATLLTFVWKGEGGYEWKEPTRKERKLTWDEERDLFGALADIGFWNLPAQVENPPNFITLDGTEWFIEGVKNGKCHVVTRYSSPLTVLVERQFLGAIAKLDAYSKGDQ